MIAEKFQSLITSGAVSGAAKRRNVRQRNFELGRIGEVIADTLFENGSSALAAARCRTELSEVFTLSKVSMLSAERPDCVKCPMRAARGCGEAIMVA